MSVGVVERKKLKGAQLAARFRRDAELAAARHVRAVALGTHADSDVPWREVSGRTRACLMLVQGSMAAERAKQMSEAPRQLGVIVVHERLEDTPANRLTWEADAAALRDQRAIEAKAVPSLPALVKGGGGGT